MLQLVSLTPHFKDRLLFPKGMLSEGLAMLRKRLPVIKTSETLLDHLPPERLNIRLEPNGSKQRKLGYCQATVIGGTLTSLGI